MRKAYVSVNGIVIDETVQEFHNILPKWRMLIGFSFLSSQMQEQYLQLLEQRCKRLNFFD